MSHHHHKKYFFLVIALLIVGGLFLFAHHKAHEFTYQSTVTYVGNQCDGAAEKVDFAITTPDKCVNGSCLIDIGGGSELTTCTENPKKLLQNEVSSYVWQEFFTDDQCRNSYQKSKFILLGACVDSVIIVKDRVGLHRGIDFVDFVDNQCIDLQGEIFIPYGKCVISPLTLNEFSKFYPASEFEPQNHFWLLLSRILFIILVILLIHLIIDFFLYCTWIREWIYCIYIRWLRPTCCKKNN